MPGVSSPEPVGVPPAPQAHSVTAEQWRRYVGVGGGILILGLATYGIWIFVVSLRWGSEGPTTAQIALVGIVLALLLTLVIVGARLIFSVVSVRREVIPEEDRKLLEPLITAGDDKAIDQYVRLSSLAGATGVATQLGLTGLPLLTVSLTLIFAALELYKPGAGFMDLAKLTLGAFIGSFVQRAATTQAVVQSGKVSDLIR